MHDLKVMLSDNVKARQMDSDGTYRKKKQDGTPVNAQETFMKEAVNARRPSPAGKKGKAVPVFESVWRILEKEKIKC